MLPRAAHLFLFILVFALHVLLAYALPREETVSVLTVFFFLSAAFLVQWADLDITVTKLMAAGLLVRLAYFFATPALSDDVFRYLWDGHLTLQGISPYLFAPQDSPDAGPQQLFGLMNSQQYHSIYPPVLQGVFALAAKAGGDSILAGIIALRGMALLAELATMLLIAKLLTIWGMPLRNLMLYALNPVVIVEFVGNLHGEVFMLPLLLGTLLLLSQGRWLSAALPFAGAVGVKLLPLMFLPFLPKRIGWGRSIVFWAVTLVLVGLMYLPFRTETLIVDTLATLRLYFASFEFNGSVYYIIREVGYWWKGYNIIGMTGVWLPRVVGGIILLMAWREGRGTRDGGRSGRTTITEWETHSMRLYGIHGDVQGLPTMWMWAWAVYFLFATTVNPWYVAVLAVFLPFVRYRFAMVWVLLVPLSYHAFTADGMMENPWLIALQYLPVYLWMGMETGLFRRLERRWAIRRAEVKRKRLMPFYPSQEKILEVGSGNGALTVLLRKEGHEVTALDIADRSIFPEVVPTLYDGGRFPFADRAFGTCQLITMLHHTPDPEHLIREAMRVADRIIIMEDIYEGELQKRITFLADSMVNGEFHGHPHTNRTDAAWRETFDRLGLKLEAVEQYRFLGLFNQATYLLVKKGAY
jgi:alpha-1,6-mannosyltransferase